LTIVVDASTVVSALVDAGSVGQWAEQLLQSNEIVAPSLLQVECTNVLRRLTSSGKIVDLDASMAYRDLMLLPISLFPFEPFADRVWALRNNLSSYDAWYVAIAESLNVPLATLDTKLTNAPGTTCKFICFSDPSV
jgi:predicted nucleic acid-binding protein